LKRIAILGAGGQAREVAWLIRDINRERPIYEFLGYIVKDVSRLSVHDSREHLLGDESWLQTNRQRVDCLAIGIGTPALRCKVADNLTSQFPDLEWPALIHPRSVLDRETSTVDSGVLLCAGAICTTNITFGPFALINFGSTIGHDVQIGRGCVVNPGANISGGVVLEDSVLIGTGAHILQYLRVGARAKVGAGAVVVADVAPKSTVIGVPAQPKRRQFLANPSQ
jgi:sugar O-acyltransferase (sialic acid O-acetyltransferase NeuD family)